MLDRRRVVLKLAAETTADIRTVDRWLDEKPVTSVARWALDTAAEKLGLADDVARIRLEGVEGAA